MNAPCKNCTDRKVGCHSKCEKYLAYRKKQEFIYELRKKESFKSTPNVAKQRSINKKGR